MKMRMWIAIAVVVGLCQMASANLLVNGDFAQPGVGGQFGTVTVSNWITWGADGWYQNDIGGDYSAKVWSPNAGIYQDWNATPGEIYTLSVQGYQTVAEQLTTESAYLKIEWFDSGYVALGQTVLDTMTGSDPAGSWNNLSGIATAVVGAAHGRITLGVQDADGAGAVFFDNAVVEAIPEPGTLAMFGLGILGFLRLRRKLSK